MATTSAQKIDKAVKSATESLNKILGKLDPDAKAEAIEKIILAIDPANTNPTSGSEQRNKAMTKGINQKGGRVNP